MRVLVIEDEQLAAERMVELLQMYDKTIEIVEVLDSVKNIVAWFKKNEQPDLIFMDIQLADGISFEVFNQVSVHSPVIFVTAYQEYAIKAFKVNSIDYLLKPLDYDELKSAMDKYHNLFRSGASQQVLQEDILNRVRRLLEKPYKNRFIIKVGEHLRPVYTEKIHYFLSKDKVTQLCTDENKIYIVDYSLDHLSEILDSEQFFRINRKSIINRQAITDIVVYSKTRLKIKLITPTEEPMIVSRDKVLAFKEWLDG